MEQYEPRGVTVYQLNIWEAIGDHHLCPGITSLHAADLDLGTVAWDCPSHKKPEKTNHPNEGRRQHMQGEFKTDRRNFLATAASSALTIGLCHADALGQEAGAQSHPTTASPLSFDSLYDTSILATTLKGEAADRLALRRLVDAWAHCADRRLAEQQSNLFVPDGTILNYEGDPSTHKPHSTIKGRTAIHSALAILNTFAVTLHMNGQSEVMIHGDQAIGETYCLVHQFTGENDKRKCQTLGIRYYDQFLRQENCWYFAERKLVIDWSDTRISIP